MASQNKANPSLFLTLKKQPNTPWVDLSSKLASNGKLTSDKYKKCLKNNHSTQTKGVIAQGGGQTLGLGLVDRNRTVVNY